MQQVTGSVAVDTTVSADGVPRDVAVADHELADDFVTFRAPILAMLRANFPRFEDHEEIYQEAWAELLGSLRNGARVRNRRGMLQTIAWRRAIDATRRRRPTSLDSEQHVSERVTDHGPTPEELAQLRLDGDALRLIVESLDPRQATVLKLRFDHQLSAREIQERLGITEKRLEKLVTEAYKAIAHQLAPASATETRWRKRQRSLLLACEIGIASPGQRRRAAEMLQRDPGCRALLAEMRATLHDVAVAVPLPVLADRRNRLGVLSRVDETWATVRHVVESIVDRAGGGAIEQTGLGGATVGASVAAKAVVACLAVGGVATLCLGVDNKTLGDPPKAQARAARPTATQRRRIEPASAAPTPPRRQAARPPTTSTPKSTSTTSKVPVSSRASTPAPSPAPSGSSEFGPGAVGSGSASHQPAAAPQDGGGEFTP